jgi:hypothetical protein
MISAEQKEHFVRTMRSALRSDGSGTTLLNAIRRFAAGGMDERTVTKLLGVVQKDLSPGEDEIFLGVMDIAFGYAGIGQAVFPEPHYDREIIEKAQPHPKQISRSQTDEFYEAMMSALRRENPREEMLYGIKRFVAGGMNQAAVLWCLIHVDRETDFEHWDIVWEVVQMTANIGEVKHEIFPDQPKR